MKGSKTDVENAILFFAKMYGKEKEYDAMLSTNFLYKVVESIVYNIFLNDFNTYNSNDIEMGHFNIIKDFAREMDKNAFVTFNDLKI